MAALFVLIALPEDAEIAISGRIEPVLVNGGATIKSMSAAFMADVERAWRKHGAKVLDVLAEKYPQAFFGGMVAMTKSHSLGDRDGCRRFRSRDGCALSALAIGIATARAASGRQCK
jgi:hypothetical protein